MVAPEQDRAALAAQADYDAGLCFRRGDLVRAARLVALAAKLGPSRGETWAGHQARITAAANREPLPVQTAVRLAAAGLTPDDPGLQAITGWNGRQRQTEAEREVS
jgi:hypothetical protein